MNDIIEINVVENITVVNIRTFNQDLDEHIFNTSNPHNVTKEQVGLGDVDNTKDINKPVSTPQEARIQEVVNNQITNSTALSNPNIAIPAEITGNAHILGVGSGTYPFWGGMVVPTNNIGTLLRVDGSYSVSLTPIIIVADVISITFNTNITTTRLSVPAIQRKKGLTINYFVGIDFISETYIENNIDDTNWSNKIHWRTSNSPEKLTFTGGVFYFEPIKVGGNYVEGLNWQIRVVKALTTENVDSTSPNNAYGNIIIPVGTYALSPRVDGEEYLYWNNITKTFSKNQAQGVGTYVVGWSYYNYSNYSDVRQLKGFVAVYSYKFGNIQLNTDDNYWAEEVTLDNILIDNNQDISNFLLKFPGVKKYNLLAGEYKANEMITNNDKSYVITVNGAGISSTVIKGWDFALDVEKVSLYNSMVDNVKYSNMTVKNLGFEQYGGGGVLKYGRSFELENVNHLMTMNSPGGYMCYIITEGMKVILDNYNIVVEEGINVYAGAWFENVILKVENFSADNVASKPWACYAILPSKINNVRVNKGTTGIFFGANKTRPIENSEITNCLVENAVEESISFDCFGNNVGLNPTIAELSIYNPTLITDTIGPYTRNQLKVYCNSRIITGTHPTEIFENYSFIGNETYLKKFYVVFSELAGTTYAGTVAKIMNVGSDGGGEFLILNNALDPADLTLLANTDLTGVNNNYQVASIMSGFFNNVIKNNTVRAAYDTGFALYCAFFNNVFDGNTAENCARGSYLYSGRMLAKGVWNAANGNIIVNNTFGGGRLNADKKGFMFQKFGEILGHNNLFANNIISGNNGLEIMNEENLHYSNNKISGKDATLTLTGVVNTNEFGSKYPVAPYPGQEFYDTVLSLKKRWNGSAWVTI